MAHAEHGLEFFERGVGMFLDVRLEFFGVELAPMSPTRFRRQRPLLGGGQIPVNGTPRHVEPPDGLGFGAARLDEFHHPFPQVQRIGFHARKRIRLCVYVNVNCYTFQIVLVFLFSVYRILLVFCFLSIGAHPDSCIRETLSLLSGKP